jgi:hypothetical protein
MNQIQNDMDDEMFMDVPMFDIGDELPMIRTINAIQEAVIENIYQFIADIWPFDACDDDSSYFI